MKTDVKIMKSFFWFNINLKFCLCFIGCQFGSEPLFFLSKNKKIHNFFFCDPIKILSELWVFEDCLL